MQISGEIRLHKGNPVHGLTVELLDTKHEHVQRLGKTLTNENGRFGFVYAREEFADLFKARPDLILRIKDRWENVVYTAKQAIPWKSGRKNVKLSLHDGDLREHHRIPTTWKRVKGRLVPDERLAEIEAAISLLAPPGAPGHNRYRRGALCPGPDIMRFDNIVEDAFDVLAGDIQAAERFAKSLRLLERDRPNYMRGSAALPRERLASHHSERAPGSHPSSREGAANPVEIATLERWLTVLGGTGREETERTPPLVPQERWVPVALAAAYVGIREPGSQYRYVSILSDQICPFGRLGEVWEAAHAALEGDPASLKHFQTVLDKAAMECGPDDGPLPLWPEPRPRPTPCPGPWPPEPDGDITVLNPDEIDLMHCLIHSRLIVIRELGLPYHIDSILPQTACAGNFIDITGSGFGNQPGTVSFARIGGGGVSAAARNWSETHIEVQVPVNATCGDILIRAVPLNIVTRPCGRYIDVYGAGTGATYFGGSEADIHSFTANGHSGPTRVDPGSTVTLLWHVCPVSNATASLEIREGNNLLVSQASLDPVSAFQYAVQNYTSTTLLECRLTATNPCSAQPVTSVLRLTVAVLPDLTIDGIEVTQAIQHYRANLHLTDPQDRGADNSLRLVTNKTAWVRAYLRSGQEPTFEGGQVRGVDGTLTVERRVGGAWTSVATIASQNGPRTAVDSFASYDAERGNIDSSLNFVVPPAVMTGLLRFTVNIAVNRPSQSAADSSSVVVDVNLQQTLNAAFITIGYTGPDAAGNPLNPPAPAPTLAQCQAETGWAMRVYPVSGAPNVRIAGTFNTNTPLNDARTAPGACSANWVPLLQQIAALVAADRAANPGNWVYYGIINMPGNLVTVPGCNGQATGGLQGQPITYAHEIGHQFGLPHARCGNAGVGNAAYPVYEPYDLPVDVPAMPIQNTNWTMASIGEYGLDINNGNIANPNNAEDFMSYCGPPWISVFTHNFLVNAAGLAPQVIATGSGGAGDRVIRDDEARLGSISNSVRPLIHMLGRFDADGRVVITSVARLETSYFVGEGVPSDLRAQLVGEDGRILAEDTVYRYVSRGGCRARVEPCCEDCGEDKTGMLKAMLEDVGPGQFLRVMRGGEIVWERARPDAPPKLGEVSATFDDEGKVKISWTCTRQVTDVTESWVRWSNNGGKSWHALTVVPEGDSVEITAAPLPSGSVIFQLLAHDGFSTTTAMSSSITIPKSTPAVSIVYPSESDRAYAERNLHLWGVASTADREAVANDAFVWYIDDREVGRGSDIWIHNPGPGRYNLRLEAHSRAGTGVVTSKFEISGPPVVR